MSMAKKKSPKPRHAPTSSTSLENFLQSYMPDVTKLAQGVRTIVRENVPGAIELLDLSSKLIGHGYGPRYADVVCVIMPFKAYVNLGFARGAVLPDPNRLLEGTGKSARHVKIRNAQDIANPALQIWLKSAATEGKAGTSAPSPWQESPSPQYDNLTAPRVGSRFQAGGGAIEFLAPYVRKA